MTVKQQIADFSQSNRTSLVFCHAEIDGISFVNLGKVLAESLSHENLRSPIIPYAAEDMLSEIVSYSESDPVIGNYLALTNIGILFEPSLGFNVKSILENASKNKTVIVCSEGTIDGQRFYFFQKGDGTSIDLAGLSYLEL